MKKLIFLIGLMVMLFSTNAVAYHKTLNDSLMNCAIGDGKACKHNYRLMSPYVSKIYIHRATCCGRYVTKYNKVFVSTPYATAMLSVLELLENCEPIDTSSLKSYANGKIKSITDLYGDEVDFAEDATSVILMNDTTVARPIKISRFPTTSASVYRYKTTVLFFYDTDDVPNDVITLVVILPHRKIHFEIDLRKMM